MEFELAGRRTFEPVPGHIVEPAECRTWVGVVEPAERRTWVGAVERHTSVAVGHTRAVFVERHMSVAVSRTQAELVVRHTSVGLVQTPN